MTESVLDALEPLKKPSCSLRTTKLEWLSRVKILVFACTIVVVVGLVPLSKEIWELSSHLLRNNFRQLGSSYLVVASRRHSRREKHEMKRVR